MRSTFLPFHRPSIEQDEVREVVETLKSGWITTGPRVKCFEEDFSRYVGVRHAVAVSSGTAALHLALAAIHLEAGDEVIVPTYTFTATAQAAIYLGARPVLVDCCPDTFNLDERIIEARITANTRAIIPVHLAGQPCQMGPILEIAQRYKLRVIEDAAHALPAKYDGKTVGTIGDITAFSFYATKTLTTGEGGMVTTDNDDYAERLRILSLHGISRDAWKRYTAGGSWYYEVVDAGFKYNMTDIAAAMGIQQLRKADQFHRRRKHIAGLYTQAFSGVDAVRPPVVQPNVKHAWNLYIILLELDMLTIDRARFIEELRARNIGTSVHFIPLHMHPYYQDALGYRCGDFPNAEWVYSRCISLPIYPGMEEQDADDVIQAVQEVSRKYRQ